MTLRELAITPEKEPIRPDRLDSFIGQDTLKENLSILLEAARKRGQPPAHTLFYGPPGLGKTTLANIMANESGGELVAAVGPSIERPADMIGIMLTVKTNGVLFIDEIHRLPMAAEEMLYSAMEDGAVDIVVGEGAQAKTIHIPIEPFTLVGATTRIGSVTPPLRDRFGATFHLEFYTKQDLRKIADRSASILGIDLEYQAGVAIADRSRGTPRIVNHLLRRAADYALVRAAGVVTEEVAVAAMTLLGIDERGLEEVDRTLLRAMAQQYKGGPVGVQTMAATIGEPVQTVEDVIEPYLMKIGVLARTPQGRVLTNKKEWM